MILLKIKDIIRPKISGNCGIMELFGSVNLGEFKWFFHCDHEVFVRNNGKIPKLFDREEKKLFVKNLVILLEEFDDYMLDNVRGICRKILPKAEFCNFYSKSGVLRIAEDDGAFGIFVLDDPGEIRFLRLSGRYHVVVFDLLGRQLVIGKRYEQRIVQEDAR